MNLDESQNVVARHKSKPKTLTCVTISRVNGSNSAANSLQSRLQQNPSNQTRALDVLIPVLRFSIDTCVASIAVQSSMCCDDDAACHERRKGSYHSDLELREGTDPDLSVQLAVKCFFFTAKLRNWVETHALSWGEKKPRSNQE